jgi:hypothetical protein
MMLTRGAGLGTVFLPGQVGCDMRRTMYHVPRYVPEGYAPLTQDMPVIAVPLGKPEGLRAPNKPLPGGCFRLDLPA